MRVLAVAMSSVQVSGLDVAAPPAATCAGVNGVSYTHDPFLVEFENDNLTDAIDSPERPLVSVTRKDTTYR
ncbi:MAG TPA: hypothetical protein VG871_00490 [Vicinamibacterales bacterium]|nr:hypothetical protein [Vicinamibacterales bacterium]